MSEASFATVPLQPPFHEAPPAVTDSRWARLWASALNDPRDIIFVNLSLAMMLTMWPPAIALFALGSFSWWLAVPYAVCFAIWFDRYTLMLHCTSHRPVFTRRFKVLNHAIPWLVGTLFGQTPTAYFVHHMGMHHKEGNLLGDLSTTMPFQRDRLGHWLQYWGRFMTIGLFELVTYHASRGRQKMVRKLLLGELAYIAGSIALGVFVSWQATLVVFVIPVVVMRTLMMAGNWGQHAFVDPEQPDSDFKSSITCINTRYNRRCFNDGYHIIHHLKPSMHYTEMADEFAKSRELYGQNDAIVFDGLDFFEVWLLLMLGNKRALARRFVQLPGAPVRTETEILALFERRLRPFRKDGTPAAA